MGRGSHDGMTILKLLKWKFLSVGIYRNKKGGAENEEATREEIETPLQTRDIETSTKYL